MKNKKNVNLQLVGMWRWEGAEDKEGDEVGWRWGWGGVRWSGGIGGGVGWGIGRVGPDLRVEHRAVVVDEAGADELVSRLGGPQAELHHPLLSCRTGPGPIRC